MSDSIGREQAKHLLRKAGFDPLADRQLLRRLAGSTLWEAKREIAKLPRE